MSEVTRKDQSGSNSPKDPEVLEKPVRRRFNAKYKLRVLELADRCTEIGQLGQLLRREGLYSSHLTTWRRQREEGTLAALQPKRRGRKAPSQAPLVQENERLRRENERLTERLRDGLARGKRSLIVIVAEGEDLGGAEAVAQRMSETLGISTRVTVLGHIQRGGSPTAADRILASRMGVTAVEALLRGETDVMTCARGGTIVTAPLRDGWAQRGKADEELLRLCAILAQ